MWAIYPISNPKSREGKMGIVCVKKNIIATIRGTNNVCVIPLCFKCFDNHFTLEPSLERSMSISGKRLPGKAAITPIRGYTVASMIAISGKHTAVATQADTPHITCVLPVILSSKQIVSLRHLIVRCLHLFFVFFSLCISSSRVCRKAGKLRSLHH